MILSYQLFIAQRIRGKSNATIAKPAIRIATLGIAIGVAVMLLSVSIVLGFKSEIRSKVIAFGSHIQITNFDTNNTYELKPIHVTDSLLSELKSIEGVEHTQRFATKPAILKTQTEVQGIVLKGVDQDFDWQFYKKNIVEGEIFYPSSNSQQPSKEVVISLYISRLLNLHVGDSFFTYFIENESVRARKFIVKGIYCTNFEDYDKMFVLADLGQIRQLNTWQETQCSGIEILVDDYKNLEEISDRVYYKVANTIQEDGSSLRPQTIEEQNPQIFSWLSMLDINVWIILVLMLIVAGFNMISGLLILIIERTNMIGILKSMGAKNSGIRQIFLYHSAFLILKGLFWGNVIGLGLIFLQYYTHILPLDASMYYISYVPVLISWPFFVAINIGTFIISTLILVVPSQLITKISPAKSIRFE